MHLDYSSETVTTFSGTWTAPTYTAPTITVPQSIAEYTGYATWDATSACESSSSDNNGGSGGDAEETANATISSAYVMLTALIASVIA
tara:strand:+ start:367 stop:630 length:264 start_codon:yes stop_codon:yes gene_type:complete